jgi:hypothetical protein
MKDEGRENRDGTPTRGVATGLLAGNAAFLRINSYTVTGAKGKGIHNRYD